MFDYPLQKKKTPFIESAIITKNSKLNTLEVLYFFWCLTCHPSGEVTHIQITSYWKSLLSNNKISRFSLKHPISVTWWAVLNSETVNVICATHMSLPCRIMRRGHFITDVAKLYNSRFVLLFSPLKGREAQGALRKLWFSIFDFISSFYLQ